MFRIRATGQVKSQGEIRKLYPNVSLPRVWDQRICDNLGIDPVLESPAPSANNLQIVYQSGVEQDANGNWVKKWITKDKYADYTN